MTAPTIKPITARRHPLAFGAYSMVLMMGLVFATNWLDHGAVPIFSHLHRYWVWLWIAELISGGAMSLLALIVRPRISAGWPDLADLLHVEAIGAFVGACGILTYFLAAMSLLGFDRVGPSGMILAALFTGLLVRSGQAAWDARRVQQYGALVDAVRVMTAANIKESGARSNG